MEKQNDEWPEGYGQYDVRTIDAVTILRGHGDEKAMLFMTALDGLKVVVALPLCDLIGATRQIVAHVAPADLLQKSLVVINGGKAAVDDVA